jgi:WD40 repeat protein
VRSRVPGAYELAFDSKSRRLIGCTSGSVVGIWDITRNDPFADPMFQGEPIAANQPSPTAVSANRRWLACVRGSDVELWDLDSQAAGPRYLLGHEQRVQGIAFSPDNGLLFTMCPKPGGGKSGTLGAILRLWDVTAADPSVEPHLLHTTGFTEIWKTSVTFSPDGRFLAVAFPMDTLLWNLKIESLYALARAVSPRELTESERKLYALPLDDEPLSSDFKLPAAFRAERSKTEQRLEASREAQANALRSRTEQRNEAAKPANANTPRGRKDRSVDGAAFSPDGTRFVTAGETELKLWDTATGEVLHDLSGNGDYFFCTAFSPDGTRIAAGGTTLKVWDATTGKTTATLIESTTRVTRVAFSPDGLRIVTGARGPNPGDPEELKLWDARSGQALTTLSKFTTQIGQQKGGLAHLAFTPDGESVLAGVLFYNTSVLKAFNAETGEEVHSVRLPDTRNLIVAMAASPDGKQVVVSGGGNSNGIQGPAEIRWCDATTGKEIFTVQGHKQAASWAAFSPDGQRIVSSGFDGTLRIWNAATGEEVRSITSGMPWVRCLVFSPDGTRILSGGTNGVLKLWDTATGEEIYSRKH